MLSKYPVVSMPLTRLLSDFTILDIHWLYSDNADCREDHLF